MLKVEICLINRLLRSVFQFNLIKKLRRYSIAKNGNSHNQEPSCFIGLSPLAQPIRGQHPGHVITLDQSECRIHYPVLARFKRFIASRPLLTVNDTAENLEKMDRAFDYVKLNDCSTSCKSRKINTKSLERTPCAIHLNDSPDQNCV